MISENGALELSFAFGFVMKKDTFLLKIHTYFQSYIDFFRFITKRLKYNLKKAFKP